MHIPLAIARQRALPLTPLAEVWRYTLVGGLVTIVDYAFLIGLTRFAGIYYLISAAIGFSVALTLSYLLSVNYVFRIRRIGDRRMEFIGFAIIGLMGLALNETIMKLLVDAFAVSYILAKVPAIGICFVFNFMVRRTVLFTGAS